MLHLPWLLSLRLFLLLSLHCWGNLEATLSPAATTHPRPYCSQKSGRRLRFAEGSAQQAWPLQARSWEESRDFLTCDSLTSALPSRPAVVAALMEHIPGPLSLGSPLHLAGVSAVLPVFQLWHLGILNRGSPALSGRWGFWRHSPFPCLHLLCISDPWRLC